MRLLTAIVAIVTATACSLAPQLSPSAVGCYAVHVAPVPAEYSRLLVPPPPAVVRLDTINGGQLEVPVAWLEQQGLNMRSASLGLMRPDWRIENGKALGVRVGRSALPLDSVVLTFGNGTNALAAALGADSTGNWSGWAFPVVGSVPANGPLLPMRLVRAECGGVRLAISAF